MRITAHFLRPLAFACLLLFPFSMGRAATVAALLAELETVKSDTAQMRLLNELSNACLMTNPADAEVYGQQLFVIANKLNDSSNIVNAYHAMGTSLSMRNNGWKALEMFKEGLACAVATGDHLSAAKLLNNMGIAFDDLGYPLDALQQYQEGLMHVRALNLPGKEVRLRMNIAVLHQRLGATARAEQEMATVLELLEDIDNPMLHAIALTNMADIIADLDNATRAAELLAIARTMASGSEHLSTLAAINTTSGKVQLLQGQHQLAIHSLEAGIKLFHSMDAPKGEGEALALLASVYTAKHDYQTAIGFLKQALDLATTHNIRNLQRDVYFALSEAFQAEGDYQQAYYQLQSYLACKNAQEAVAERNELQRLELLYNLREHEEVFAAQEAAAASKDALLVLLAVLLTMAITLAYVVWKYLQANKKANVRLKQLNQLLWERSNQRSKQIQKLAHYNAHEVQAPLTRIQGLVNAMREESSASVDRNGKLEMLESSAYDLDQVIRRMNDIIDKGPPAVDKLPA